MSRQTEFERAITRAHNVSRNRGLNSIAKARSYPVIRFRNQANIELFKEVLGKDVPGGLSSPARVTAAPNGRRLKPNTNYVFMRSLEPFGHHRVTLNFPLNKGHYNNNKFGLASKNNVNRIIQNLSQVQLRNAIRTGNVTEVRRLLNAGASVNGVHNRMTPLMYAASVGRAPVIRLLLNRGANARARTNDVYGRTALIFAAEYGNVNAVRALLRHSNLNARGVNGGTALSTAINARALEIVRMLLRAGARLQPNNLESIENNNELNAMKKLISNSTNTNYGLHGMYIATNKVRLPAPNNRTDPISLHKFKKGDTATRILQNGRSTYIRTSAFNTHFGHEWKTMNPNSKNFISNKKTHPLTRAKVRRNEVSRVKFI